MSLKLDDSALSTQVNSQKNLRVYMSLKLDDSALSTQVNSQKNLRVCILRIYEPECTVNKSIVP